MITEQISLNSERRGGKAMNVFLRTCCYKYQTQVPYQIIKIDYKKCNNHEIQASNCLVLFRRVNENDELINLNRFQSYFLILSRSFSLATFYFDLSILKNNT